MSLNGLDSDAVTQAHQNALAEAGGWFLLSYITRDTVDLLGQGSGGVSEARKAVESYEEKSPLYGVVQYRRKRFILKYVPDGTSRLLQVRLAVQFQSVLDTLTPYDTVFSFAAAHELSESALGLSNILFSSPSQRSQTSSSSSLRQRRLNEIAEDAEESSVPKVNDTSERPSPASPPPRVDSLEIGRLPPTIERSSLLQATMMQEPEQRSTDTNPHISRSSAGLAPLVTEQTSYLPSIPTVASPIITNKELPPPPANDSPISPTSPDKNKSVALRPSLDFSIPQIESDSDDDFRRPMPKDYPPQIRYSAHLSAAESSSISKWSDDVLASTVKPKQKRVPKAQPDPQVRPKTSGNGSEIAQPRRVNLPTTVRVPTRSSAQSSRPGSQQSTRSVPARFIPSSDLPAIPSPTMPTFHQRMPSPQHSPSQASSLAHDTPAVAPEKLRLMKALQMRKRRQLLTQRSSTAPPASNNLLASTDSSQSTFSEISRANSLPVEPDTAGQNTESSNKHQSQTTSPTSVVTTSDNHSTKPSSLSEESPQNGSQTSLSSDTGSSTTPKAEGDAARQPTDKREIIESSHTANPGVATSTLPLQIQAAVETVETKPATSRPLTYHCTTADFLADIEEEDRDRAVSIIEADEPSGPVVRDIEPHNQRYPFDSPVLQAIQRSADVSDVSDDELFMEELQNATVHEAKPVSVNRTPATPVLSNASIRTNTIDLSSEPASVRSDRSLARISTKHTARSPSNDSQMSSPDLRRAVSRAGSTRSLSTALPQWPPAPTEPMPALPKQRVIMGASISKRVKTFEGLSQRDSLVLTPPTKEPASRSTSLSTMLKRASFLGHSPSEEVSQKSSSKKVASPVSSPLRSTFNAPEHESPSKPWLQRPGTSTEVYSPIHRGETVSVTARIIRDPIKPNSAHGTSEPSQKMYASPLIVEHDAGDKLQLKPPVSRELSTQSMDSLATSPTLSERRRFSFSSHKSNGQKLSPVDNKSHRLSFAGHRKAPKSAGESSSIAEEKKQSRTSRMLKRLSGLGKARGARESIALSPSRDQPPLDIAEEPTEPNEDNEPDLAHTSIRHVVDIGEVNVQFADTLLWKRRFLRVDDQGYLIFAPPTNDSSSRGKSRKIHLEDLHRPTLPDLEREEMAWSVLLDLKDGGTVQCACESKSAQRAVLKMLLDAHNAYHQLYG